MVRRSHLFRGWYPRAVDDTGRISLPPGFRRRRLFLLAVTANGEEHIEAYPRKDWERLEARDGLFPKVTEVSLELRGRVQIPSRVRTAARLGQRVLLIGMGARFEIWNPETRACYERSAGRAG